MTAYSARRRTEVPLWEPLSVQYADFALWQREILGEESDPDSLASRQLAYWRTQLAGLPEQIDLPADRPRPAAATNGGGSHVSAVDADLVDAITRLAAQHRSTPFMVVHAALAVLLARLSGTRDIAIGSPIAGRGERALDDLVGMFVNTLVLRTEIDTRESFSDLLARVREIDVAGFSNSDVPFERIVEVLDPVRSPARHPLFQVALTFQNLPSTAVELDSLTIRSIEFDTRIAKFDLQVTFTTGAHGGFDIEWNYATDLFDADTVAEFGERMHRLLAAAVLDPVVAVGDLDLLAESERHAALARATAGGRSEAVEGDLYSTFLQAAQANPDRVAVRFDTRSLTYAEVAAAAHRLARRLIAAGVGPESLVAIALPRDERLVIAIVAVLAAGGAYVPIDITNPADRIAHILSDSAPHALIATSADPILDPSNTKTVLIDVEDFSQWPDGPIADAERTATLLPTGAAYVIYTSGSTGRPKGVVVNHRNVLALFANIVRRFDFDETDVWTMFHSHAFDFSVWELWGALQYGGTLVVVDYFTSRSPERFRELCVREGITVLNQTPSAFYQFAEADRLAVASGEPALSLRYVVFGGEALDLVKLRGWYERYGEQSAVLVNMYGITETTVHVSYRALDALTARESNSPLIGVGLPGFRVYVLDDRLHPVPPKVQGELYVAGPQVSRGYHGRPDLGAARFVADPFAAEPGAQMYRTGDVGRWNSDGELEYAGRSDLQVQLRGFRIELGEVESALLDYPGVADAVATVHADEHLGDRLVAYVVPRAGSTVDPASLRDGVGEFLTSYMVPDAIVVLDALPLTPNGKLDRRALPAPVFEVTRFRAPASPIEQTVAAVFAEVLHLDRVGLDDDFFMLGGNCTAGDPGGCAPRVGTRHERPRA